MSSYRDERAALQERVDVLQEDLRDARQKAEKVDALDRDVADKEKEIARLRARLEKHEGPPKPDQRGGAAVIAAMAALLVAGGAGAFFLVRRPAPAPPPVAAAVDPGEELPEPCAAYFREVELCVERRPAMASMRDAATQQRAAFKSALAMPAAKDAVLTSCGQALKALQEACK